MKAASKGAHNAGGLTIGILPGMKREDSNRYIKFPIATGMGYARNVLVVRAGHVVIAIGGRYGTLSEIGFALNEKIPVVGLGTWEFHKNGVTDPGINVVKTPKEAVDLALYLIGKMKK